MLLLYALILCLTEFMLPCFYTCSTVFSLLQPLTRALEPLLLLLECARAPHPFLCAWKRAMRTATKWLPTNQEISRFLSSGWRHKDSVGEGSCMQEKGAVSYKNQGEYFGQFCGRLGRLNWIRRKRRTNPGFSNFACVTVATYFTYFESLIVYLTTRRPCYVSIKAYNAVFGSSEPLHLLKGWWACRCHPYIESLPSLW